MDLSKYERGSYNGIKFFTPSSSITGGPKTIEHDYPKSGRKEVEYMGLNKKRFSLECIIYGEDYYTLRRNFIAELDKQEYGNLIHPIDGELRVAVMAPYNINESEDNLGIARFTVDFQVVSDKAEPDQASSFDGKIEVAKNSILDNSLSFMQEFYKTNFAASFQSASDQLSSFTDSIEENTNELLGDQGVKNDLNALFNEVRAKPFASIETAESFYSSIQTMLSDLGLLGTGTARFNTYQSLFNSGDEIVTSDLTVAQSEVQTNTDGVNAIIQTQSLLYAYEATRDVDFVLLSDLRATQEILETQYAKVYPSLDGKLKSDLDELRNLFNSYYLTLNVYDIKEVQGNGESLNVLCYRYYGNLDFFDIIKELNNISNPAFVEGTVEILSNDTF